MAEGPLVMGILNVTPDSFSDGGLFLDRDAALRHAEMMMEAGADVIDIGGESTRPGADRVSEAEEMDRVLPVIEAIRKRLPIAISVDTSTAAVMAAAFEFNVEIINDVRALSRPGALAACGESEALLVLMHMQGTPSTMQDAPYYADLFGDLNQFFEKRIEACGLAGIASDRLILDPGFGFGKEAHHNFSLVAGLHRFAHHGLPMMVGLSRKRSIAGIARDVIAASVAGHLLAIQAGASIVRVHDVEPMVSAINVLRAVREWEG